MAKLKWDEVGERVYETGISNAVLYLEDGRGVPWNGITQVVEESINNVEELHYDGVKYADVVTIGDFKGSIRAFTYPDEFWPYEGSLEAQTGLYFMHQPPKKFSVAYKTNVGDDVNGLDSGYKIHILYNLTAVPAQKSYETISDTVEPMEFEWNVTSVPEQVYGFMPTAQIVINSRRMDSNLLKDIEDILFGSEDNDSYLPSLQSLHTFIKKWNRLIITEFDDGTWTAVSRAEGIITMLDDTTFQIDTDTAEYIDADTYTIASSDKNEDDIWQ